MVKKEQIKNEISNFQVINNKIKVIKGDIIDQHVDVIVNSTNEGMVCGTGSDGMEHAAGVDKAINKAAGPELFKACKKILDCKNSGTSIRMFSAISLFVEGGLTLTGEFLAKNRPIRPLCMLNNLVAGEHRT